MKLITICLLLLSFGLQAQREYNVLPKWKKGDVRYAKHVASSTVSVNGEVIQSTDVTSNYTIKVLEIGEFYTLEFTQKSDQYDIDVSINDGSQDSMQVLMNELMSIISELSSEFKFKVLLDKENGQAFELLNSDEFIELVKEGSKAVFEEIVKFNNREKVDLDDRVNEYLEEVSPQMIETILNGLNYLFQCYTFVCEINGETSEEVMVHDINTLGAMGDTEVPAIVSVASTKRGSTLDILVDYQYDQTEFLKVIRNSSPDFSEMQTKDFILEEVQEFEFDMKSTWPNSSMSSVTFQMTFPDDSGMVRVEDFTTVVYSKTP
jgi:hypothetical protein